MKQTRGYMCVCDFIKKRPHPNDKLLFSFSPGKTA